MFDNPTALTAVTVANLIGIASGVMRKYASDQTSVPPVLLRWNGKLVSSR